MIQRNLYLERIQAFMDKPVIKVITGIRRCGKSTLLKQLVEKLLSENIPPENILLINKDSLQFDFIQTYTDLDNYVNEKFLNIKGKKYILIDEVQEIEAWEKALSGFLSDEIADLIITGSNSRMLSSELATYITGRYIEFPVFTLTFSEFLEFRKEKNPTLNIQEEFQNFLRFGGFPGIHHFELVEEFVYQYLQSIYYTIILKDVVSKNQIRDISLLERITRFISNNCGNITSAKKIVDFIKSQQLKGTVDTVLSYLKMLISAYIIHEARRYDLKGKRLLEINGKYYISDLGIKHSILGYRFDDIEGHLENIVYMELLARGYKVDIGKLRNTEIDFIAIKNSEKIYIQVCYLLHEQSTIVREFNPLLEIKDNYTKIVLSLDNFFPAERQGVFWYNLIDFLQTK